MAGDASHRSTPWSAKALTREVRPGLSRYWPVLVDEAVAKTGSVVIGSGIRGSKLRLPGRVLASLPSAQVLPGLGIPVNP